MPKATLSFTLPEEQSEFTAAVEGAAARMLIWEIDQHCRGLIKHGDLPEEIDRHLQEIRDMIRNAHGITIE
jgi:hypothetical protein